MKFLHTKEGCWINPAYIVSIQEIDGSLYTELNNGGTYGLDGKNLSLDELLMAFSRPEDMVCNEYREALRERFTRLVEEDYDDAIKLLEGFGVGRFSDLKPELYKAFDAALNKLE